MESSRAKCSSKIIWYIVIGLVVISLAVLLCTTKSNEDYDLAQEADYRDNAVRAILSSMTVDEQANQEAADRFDSADLAWRIAVSASDRNRLWKARKAAEEAYELELLIYRHHPEYR